MIEAIISSSMQLKYGHHSDKMKIQLLQDLK